MELHETINMMISVDYKERFKAEYCQLKIRYEKLKAMCEKWDKGELNFEPTCPRNLYAIQLRIMEDYLDVLKVRAILENVNLEE